MLSHSTILLPSILKVTDCFCFRVDSRMSNLFMYLIRSGLPPTTDDGDDFEAGGAEGAEEEDL